LRVWRTAFSCGLLALMLVAGPGRATSAETSEQDDMALIGRYVDATHAQQQALRGVEMEVDIDATLPKLKKSATFHALRRISRLGQITYKALGFSGDNTVRKEVITRYLAAEAEGRESGEIAITPANYKFKHRGKWESNGRAVEILQLTPKEKRVGLFKGELWVDIETGMPVREVGEFVKSPSVFLKKVTFVREYELHDGVAIPKRIESTVDTRIVGRAELQISYTNITSPQILPEEVPAVPPQGTQGDPGTKSAETAEPVVTQ
jgi:hypothetical protein